MRYFDASALAKWYIDESGTDLVKRLLDAPAATSRLSGVEVPSAIIRRAREAATPAARRDGVLHSFNLGLADMFIVELAPDVVLAANGILSRNTLRASDAIHLASCVSLSHELGADIPFVAFDARLRAAAIAEGLMVEP